MRVFRKELTVSASIRLGLGEKRTGLCTNRLTKRRRGPQETMGGPEGGVMPIGVIAVLNP